MCVSCVLTTILYVIPVCMRFIQRSIGADQFNEFMTVYTPISCNLNPVAVITTICVMQDDIRQAVFSSLPNRLQLLLQSTMVARATISISVYPQFHPTVIYKCNKPSNM
ncbi:unnamed protein product [Gongylonema pulchrum]|uniref:G_PROTEIN_RECEP_F1_2 domain-containing protein n=1 Tax=Gongylonema pulchrum TaxID=637853 RepID=A0A183CXH4_9BILA|nr:unnamed protein product [Gongylonema pulchrum]